MSQNILSERVLQSYFSFVFWGHQMQAKTSYHNNSYHSFSNGILY